MSYSAVLRSALTGALGIAVLGLTAAPPPRPEADAVKPPVALRLSIDAGHYRKLLQDATCTQHCLALRDALVDTVRSLLQTSYAFLDWNGGKSSARDTVEIRWIERAPPELPGSQLDFRIRSSTPRMRRVNYPVDFETYADFSRRQASPHSWHPDSLRRAWVVRLASTLQQPELLVEVFGRIPINARVTLGGPGRATVGVRPGDIGASDDMRPAFVVRSRIVDTVNNTDEVGELILAKCLTTLGAPGYNCETLRLDYISHSIAGAALVDLLGRATLADTSVLVVEYATPTKPSRYSGAMLPVEGLP
jgi:hypothetical protein